MNRRRNSLKKLPPVRSRCKNTNLSVAIISVPPEAEVPVGRVDHQRFDLQGIRVERVEWHRLDDDVGAEPELLRVTQEQFHRDLVFERKARRIKDREARPVLSAMCLVLDDLRQAWPDPILGELLAFALHDRLRAK